MANSRPYPQTNEIPLINTAALTQQEIQQVFATLNDLIKQFNSVVALQGGLKQEIQSIIKRINSIYPFTSTSDDFGYITNHTLKVWPVTNFILGDQSGTTLLDVVATHGSSSVTFTAAAGPFKVLAGAISLDAGGDFGMATVNAGADLGLYSTGKVIAQSNFYAPNFYVESGGTIYADNGMAGINGSFQSGNVLFENGLLVQGDPTQGGGGGGVSDVTGVGPPHSLNVRESGNLGVGTGNWTDLKTLFTSIAPGVKWPGSSDLTTLGTIGTGTWAGTAVAIAHGGTGQTAKQAAFDALSPASATGDIIYYSAGGHNVALVANATSTPMYLESDSGDVPIWSVITTLGTITTGVWNGTVIDVAHGGTGFAAAPMDGQLLIGDTATSLYVQATLTGTANQVTVTNAGGSITLSLPSQIAPTSNSTTAWQFVPHGSGSPVLDIDTTNLRVGINNNAPGVAFDVTGAGRFSTSITVGPLQIVIGSSTVGEIKNNGVLALAFDPSGNTTIEQGLFANNVTVNGGSLTFGATGHLILPTS